MKYILETKRLLVRELNLDDTGFIVELLNTPGWLEFIGDRNVKTEKQAKAYLANGPLKSYRENGFGLYLVKTKQQNARIGICGIVRRDTLDHPDLGFAFLPEFAGQGYAREVAKATVKYAYDQLRIPTILAITKPDNERSIKLLESIGLKFVKMFHLAHESDDLLLYSIDLHPKGS